MTNVIKFKSALCQAYAHLFGQKQYAHIAKQHTPDTLAEAMTNALQAGGADKNGEGIKKACKALKIKHTYKAIAAYLNGGKKQC